MPASAGEEDDAGAAAKPKLRFAVGDRVACNMGGGTWHTGTVMDLNYREDNWPPGKIAPYQVKLDESCGGEMIWAPMDLPQVVRAESCAPLATPSLPEDGGDAAEALRVAKEELPVLKALPFVIAIEGPTALRAAELRGELFTPTDASGPWELKVRMRGPDEGEYAGEHRLTVKLNAAWPGSAAEVRFCSLIHHLCVVSEGGLLEAPALADATTAVMAKAQPAGRSLCAVLRAVHLLLSDPASVLAPGAAEGLEHEKAANGKRQSLIASYLPQRKHPQLFDADRGWPEEWFDPSAWEAFASRSSDTWRSLAKEEAREVYSFPLFTQAFCELLVEELYGFYASGLPARRPNTMNNYGVVINEIGLEPMLSRLQQEFLQPIAHALFPGDCSHLDRHHSFVVRYKVGEDLGLDMHTDDSDVTFNICLGLDFKGAGLRFCGDQGASDHRHASALYFHERGRCVAHRGHRRHGADDITEGERLNLIVWNMSSEYRKTRACARYHMQSRATGYQKEGGPPDKVCLSFTHDRDYGTFLPYADKIKQHRGGGWCPPRHAQYENFRKEPSDKGEVESPSSGA